MEPPGEPYTGDAPAPRPARVVGPALPTGESSSEHVEKHSEARRSAEDFEPAFGPSMPDEDDILRAASAAPTIDPLLGSVPIPSESASSSTGHDLAERDAWDRLRTDPNASLAALNPKEREEWMLKLPEGKRQVLDYDQLQQNVLSFSRKGTSGATMDASWAESPADRARRESAGVAPKTSLDLAKQMVAERLAREKAELVAQQTAEFNEKHRAKSLLEVAAEEKARAAKEAKAKERRKEERRKEKEDSRRKKKKRSRDERDKDKHKRRHKSDKKDKRRHKKHKRDDSDSSSSDYDSSSSSSSSSSRERRSKKKKTASADPQVAFDPYGLSSSTASTGSSYWDRERDMSSSRFDAAKKQSALRDAQLLNTRFSSGASLNRFG